MAFKCSVVDGALVAEFDSMMSEWLSASLPRYRRALQERLEQYREYDPLCVQLGLALPVTPLSSKMLRALRDHWCGRTPDDSLRGWMEADLFTRMRDDADRVLATLPGVDQPLRLCSAGEVESWFWVLVNMRIGYGVEHGVLGPGCPPIDDSFVKNADWNDPQTPVRFAVWWLDKVARGLREVSGQSLPEFSS